jgi:DNA-binding PadR family transcriptional regulator
MSYDTQGLARNINELLVLSALRKGRRHGYQIALDVEAASGGVFDLQHGTLYPLLHRLERDGLIAGRWREGDGRRRKEYTLTAAGRRHLGVEGRALHVAMERLSEVLGIAHTVLRPRRAQG